MKHAFIVLGLLAAFSACTRGGEQKNCYHATTREEYDHLIKQRATDSKAPITVAGVEYDCLDNLPTDTGKCYQAKSKEEFSKLSAEQMGNPNMLVMVEGRAYDCVKAAP